MRVFLLWHRHEVLDHDDDKLIGVYGTRLHAQMAVQRAKNLPGFRDSPDAFSIEEYEIGVDHWTGGFATIATVHFRETTPEGDRWRAVHAQPLGEDRYRILSYAQGEDLPSPLEPDQVVCCHISKVDGIPDCLVVVAIEDDAS